ncbi:hypothetical protein [Streptomyces formicae]
MSIDHRAVAEKHLDTAARHCNENPPDMRIAEVAAWIGQGHATLARDEERAANYATMRDAITLLRRREQTVRELVSSHIAKALASRDSARWQSARMLATALDEADCNVDNLIDERLTDDGWDPRSAYKAPASATPSGDPWAPKPDITEDVPKPVREVVADQLADMFLAHESDDVHRCARRLAYSLKEQGVDITEAIKDRIADLTLGRDPSDPPF